MAEASQIEQVFSVEEAPTGPQGMHLTRSDEHDIKMDFAQNEQLSP